MKLGELLLQTGYVMTILNHLFMHEKNDKLLKLIAILARLINRERKKGGEIDEKNNRMGGPHYVIFYGCRTE